MVEIYNENIFDLLDIQAPACNLREDTTRGVYVDGCTERQIDSPEAALRLLELGSKNRRVASTSMNRESSRSHSVFSLRIESRQHDAHSQLMHVSASLLELFQYCYYAYFTLR